MAQSIRSIMTSNPCTIDARETVAYAAKMMQAEDVGLAPIVEGDKLIGILTDRDIATRVAAEGRDPEQVKVREVASTQLVTIDPQQDLDEALRIMAKHQVRRLPVVEEDGRLVGVVAQADIARQSDDRTTGQLVEEISESGGQMSSFEEGRYQPIGVGGVQPVVPPVEDETLQEQPEEESVSRVRAASSRGRKRRTTSRSRSTGGRKTSSRKRSTSGRKTSSRKRKTSSRKTSSRKRKTTGRTTVRTAGRKGGRAAARKRSTGTRRKSTGTRRKSTGTRRKSTARKSTGTRRKSTARKSTGTRRKTSSRKTTSRKRSAAGRKGGRATARKRATARSAGRKGGRATARKRSTGGSRKTSGRRRTTRRKTSS